MILKTNRATVKVDKLCELKCFLGKLEDFDLIMKIIYPHQSQQQKKKPFGLEECNQSFRNCQLAFGRDIASKNHRVNVGKAHGKNVLNIPSTKKRTSYTVFKYK